MNRPPEKAKSVKQRSLDIFAAIERIERRDPDRRAALVKLYEGIAKQLTEDMQRFDPWTFEAQQEADEPIIVEQCK